MLVSNLTCVKFTASRRPRLDVVVVVDFVDDDDGLAEALGGGVPAVEEEDGMEDDASVRSKTGLGMSDTRRDAGDDAM